MIKPSTTVLAIAFAALLQQYLGRQQKRLGPVGMCRDLLPESSPARAEMSEPAAVAAVEIKPPLSSPGIGGEAIRAEPCRSFAESYFEARDKFRRATESVAGAELTSLVVVPDGLYTMDIAVIPGSGDGLVVHTSGTHGVEGYAGSAIQIAMLRHLSSMEKKSSAPLLQPTLILVHAVNPYGMAHFRRTNEHNVDLNRNALHPEEWAEVLARDPNIAGYDDFDLPLFNPPRPPTLRDAYITFYLLAAKAIFLHGFVNMKRSMVTAQYHNPLGIFYGGTKLEPSHKLLQEFLVEGRWAAANGTVTWIDVHTGLGPAGVDTLLVHGRPGDDERSPKEWFPNSPRPLQYHFGGSSAGDDDVDDVTSGYDLTQGTVNDFYSELFDSPASHPLVVAQEFGTVPGVSVARGMILENMAFNFAPGEQGFWSAFSRDVFYVRTDEWRRSILERGLTVLHQAIARSSTSARTK